MPLGVLAILKALAFLAFEGCVCVRVYDVCGCQSVMCVSLCRCVHVCARMCIYMQVCACACVPVHARVRACACVLIILSKIQCPELT